MSRSPRRIRARSKDPKRPAQAASNSSKTGLKIGDAAKLINEKPFVIRFWETEFPFLKAGHSRYKHRVYGPADIENLKLVKRLLHEERFTIEGAKKHLRQHGLEQVRAELAGGPSRIAKVSHEATPPANASALRRTIAEIREELTTLHKMLED